ncbi:MAG: DUF1289 domain-containing protein [Pseudomonadota bacterium]
MTLASPCTGICRLDPVTSWCQGCGRGGDEIVDWGTQPAAWRARVWDEIPARLQQMGVACRRLPWTSDETRDFVRSALKQGSGTWVMGVVGAVAEFTAAPGESVNMWETGDTLRATTKNGAVAMTLDDGVRALTFDPPDGDTPPRIVLAVKRERGRLPVAKTLADLGPDTDALLSDGDGQLFDLGLGRREARFCVRAARGNAGAALRSAVGMPFAAALAKIGGPLLRDSPPRVVETALGRMEVTGAIPPPGGQSPAGPHTHLLPDHLATGRAMPPGMDLPRSYLPGAIYYPPS